MVACGPGTLSGNGKALPDDCRAARRCQRGVDGCARETDGGDKSQPVTAEYRCRGGRRMGGLVSPGQHDRNSLEVSGVSKCDS